MNCGSNQIFGWAVLECMRGSGVLFEFLWCVREFSIDSLFRMNFMSRRNEMNDMLLVLSCVGLQSRCELNAWMSWLVQLDSRQNVHWSFSVVRCLNMLFCRGYLWAVYTPQPLRCQIKIKNGKQPVNAGRWFILTKFDNVHNNGGQIEQYFLPGSKENKDTQL